MERGEDIFSNSHRSRRKAEEKVEKPEEKKVVEVVVTNKAIVRKKSLTKRAIEVIFGGDGNSVRNYLIWDVIVPQIKDVVTDVVTQGVERLIHGDGASPTRRGSRPGQYTNYNSRYTRPTVVPGKVSNRPSPTVRSHSVDDVILKTRLDAQRVLEKLEEIASKYNAVTVADLYACVEWSASHTDGNWGWTIDDLDDFSIRKIPEGFLIDLPTPEFLN